ncbi:MAG: zf-HC2 domain-containing protein [Fibrobacteres bacterium]|nr:zf-HC2 domain-containing protein [Fibrobacterota bacterium]
MDKHLDVEALSDYAEGLLDGPRRAAADAHLAGCADCRRGLAAAQAYFRELGGLEPVPAPADFLAKVRARLPQSASPWRRLWSDLSAAIRVVPTPIAVGLILGVTAITVYLRHGGPDQNRLVPLSATSRDAAPMADLPRAPQAAPAPLRPPAPVARKVPMDLSRPNQTRIGGRRERFPSEEAAPAQPPASEPALVAAPGQGGQAANVPGNVPAPTEAAADRMQAGAGEGVASTPERGKATSPLAAAKAQPRPAEKKAVRADDEAAVSPFGCALTLKFPGDSAAILAGLRSMGIRYEAGSGDRGLRQYFLIVPAPMLRGLVPYLSRYGTLILQGEPPAARTDSIAVRLRLRLPVP